MSFILWSLSFCHLIYAFILASHTILFMFMLFYSLSIWISFFSFKNINKGETPLQKLVPWIHGLVVTILRIVVDLWT